MYLAYKKKILGIYLIKRDIHLNKIHDISSFFF
jgi:hypothetical protein